MLLCALGWREFAMHETENMLALSVALAEGAAAAFTSHLILSSDPCTHLPILIIQHPRTIAMLAVILAVFRYHGQGRIFCFGNHVVFCSGGIQSPVREHRTNAIRLARAVLPLREPTFHPGTLSTQYTLTSSDDVALKCSRMSTEKVL
jgi:hypothetical protein